MDIITRVENKLAGTCEYCGGPRVGNDGIIHSLNCNIKLAENIRNLTAELDNMRIDLAQLKKETIGMEHQDEYREMLFHLTEFTNLMNRRAIMNTNRGGNGNPF